MLEQVKSRPTYVLTLLRNTIRNLLASILKQIYEEEQARKGNKNIELILKFPQARESIKLVNEMAYGTPIFARI